MDFLNKTLKIKKMNMLLTILKENDYVCMIEVNPHSNESIVFSVPVTVSSTMYVESLPIHVHEEFRKKGMCT